MATADNKESYNYIDGLFTQPRTSRSTFAIVNPCTEEKLFDLPVSGADDVNDAVAAAKRVAGEYARTTREQRMEWLTKVAAYLRQHSEEVALSISREMGAPIPLAKGAHMGGSLGNLESVVLALSTFNFEEKLGDRTLIQHEPVGVVGCITPWNWPLTLIAQKCGAALAAGCPVVLKPAELTPTCALWFARACHAAGFPAGVFNLVQGIGFDIGPVLCSHPDVDAVSFTGSTRAGVDVAIKAAPSIKRVCQELGGKSANLVVDDEDFAVAVRRGVLSCWNNSGQTCIAPTRMLIPRARLPEAEEIAKKAAEAIRLADLNATAPPAAGTELLGPVVSLAQFNRIQDMMQKGIEKDQLKVVTGGVGRAQEKGFYVKPTVLLCPNNRATLAQEEIFGPVLCMIPYDSEQEAIAMANDTVYGLAAYLQCKDPRKAVEIARQLKAGQVTVNVVPRDRLAPFGGYKQSGNGREGGAWGIHEFVETKAMFVGADAINN